MVQILDQDGMSPLARAVEAAVDPARDGHIDGHAHGLGGAVGAVGLGGGGARGCAAPEGDGHLTKASKYVSKLAVIR